jgi:hypothetical protein
MRVFKIFQCYIWNVMEKWQSISPKSPENQMQMIAELSYRNFRNEFQDIDSAFTKENWKVILRQASWKWIPFTVELLSDRPYGRSFRWHWLSNAIMEEVLKMKTLIWDSVAAENKTCFDNIQKLLVLYINNVRVLLLIPASTL